MIKEGRTPCINPRCRCTAAADKFPDEMICYKCFKALPVELKTEHRELWKQYRLYDRRVTRNFDPMKMEQLKNIRNRYGFRIHQNWLRIKAHVLAPEKPEGLDSFLQELGMA